MEMFGYYLADSLRGEITVRIITETDPGLNNLKLRIALCEDSIYYVAPNGLRWHNQTFRDMIPSTAGQGVTLVVGDTLEYTFPFTTPDPIVGATCCLVAWVQSDQNRHIIQGARAEISQLSPVSVKDGILVPDQLTLSQNYPNPFNAQTRIDFVSVGGNVNLAVYDITGGLVKTLVDGSYAAGAHSVIWDGTDNFGKSVASGVYFYRLKDAGDSQIKRMALLK